MESLSACALKADTALHNLTLKRANNQNRIKPDNIGIDFFVLGTILHMRGIIFGGARWLRNFQMSLLKKHGQGLGVDASVN